MTKQYEVALLCGGGKLPVNVAEACMANGITPLIITFKGQPQPDMKHYTFDTKQYGLGQVGKVLETLKENGIKRVCMAGHLSKPSLFEIKFDITGLKLMAKLSSKHDDALLRAVCDLFEGNGITISAAHELCPDLLAPVGLVTGGDALPQWQMADIAMGYNAVKVLGDLDIGQAAIIKSGVVIGVEGVEGTKALIERCAPLRGDSSGGILVKVAKPKQTLKVDMPTVGVDTILSLGDYKYDGMAVLSGKTLMLDKLDMISEAKSRKLFIYGMTEGEC